MSATTEESAPRGADGGARRPGRRRSDPWKVAFVVLLIVTALTVVTWLLLGSRLLVVREIEVTGTDRLDPAQVAAAVDVATGTPLARVDTAAAERRARELRLVESVEVSRGWPATLRVEVVERTPRLAMRAGDGFRLVDGDGVRVADTDTRPEDYPLITVDGEPEGDPAVAAAAEVVAQMPAAVAGRVEEIDAQERAAITLTLDDGAVVQWGGTERTAEKSEILTILLHEHPSGPDRSYDVSAPDMAVVK
ncbi:cell division protein FtsQ/DivIB [Streptomonospora nanhaiensis]|uniref:cell division protein FtsQ/DivIB n=1 Tax=Streptomonospora nanhaiensis TaxID=1323731 RepID=UPI001C99F35C|nr:FtsQ-type POTRA domain-containing protein [Streptomonospora nanhaiensis]MBX9390732.1 FtsQ-type POTRA domain-containing protein [Streptomonospora nanhaiensis]